MSKKCRAYSESKLGLEPADNRKSFYAGWEAAIKYVLTRDISQEYVDETKKDRHEIVGACVTCGAPHGFWLSAPPSDFIGPSVIKAISKRKWVGLTDEERMEIRLHSTRNMGENFQETLCKAIEAKLKEKNT